MCDNMSYQTLKIDKFKLLFFTKDKFKLKIKSTIDNSSSIILKKFDHVWTLKIFARSWLFSSLIMASWSMGGIDNLTK